MNKQADQGIILSRVDFGERDRILTVLLKDNGKARLFAKGVRSAKSKLAGGIELMSESKLSFIKGRGEMYTLASSRLIQHFGNIVLDYDKTQLAYEVLKITNKVIDDGHGQDHYPLLLASLKHLDNKKLDHSAVSIWFYIKLLELMGNTINLKTDNKNKSLEESNSYTFDHDKSCFCPEKTGLYTKASIKLLRLLSESDKPIVANIPTEEQVKINKLLSQLVQVAIR